ncbi:MAG: 50S ribosomal protein L29 [Microgenomates group bacterium]
MKKKELQELRTKTKREILELIRKTEEELVKLRLEKEAGRLKDVHLVTKKSDDLARLKTILKEKELYENP